MDAADAPAGAAAALAATSTAAASPPVAATLRSGLQGLLGALGPPDWQHVHMVLGQGGALEGLRRTALAELKREHDQQHRFSGKV